MSAKPEKINIIRVDCNICANTVIETSIVICQFCSFESCYRCVERFLMGIDDDKPRCMNNDCKKVWSYEFISQNFSAAFHNKRYRDRRAQLAYERERALMPGTQPLVQREIEQNKIKEQIEKIHDEIHVFNSRIRKCLGDIRKLRRSMNDCNEEKKESENTFTRSCPVEECRGFLSSALKCGICETWACKDCHLPKQSKNDDEHTCNPDTVATIKLLAKDTKPCPSCSTPIYKISGCDQMFCITCHTAFSWKNGKIERGVIHNPHFYLWQKELNGGNNVRRDIAMRCGGPPNLWKIEAQIELFYDKSFISSCKDVKKDEHDREFEVVFDDVGKAHRLIGHINGVELHRYPRNIGDMDNSQLRVDFLMNRLSEKDFKNKLKKNMKKQEKCGDFNMVLSNFTGTLVDILGNICDGDIYNVNEYVRSMYKLRKYTNKELKKIGQRYGNTYPVIDTKWAFH